MVTLDQLKKIMPFAGSKAGFFLVPLNDAMEDFGIDTPARRAAFLAHVAVESGSLRYVSEIASGLAYNGRKDLGNTKPEAIRIARLHGSSPGPWWKGHGLIQITGFNNHLACGNALGLDLLNQPTLLEKPVNAARSAGWFWQENNLNKWVDSGDFDGLSDMINRGHKTKVFGDANGFAERLASFNRGLREFGELA